MSLLCILCATGCCNFMCRHILLTSSPAKFGHVLLYSPCLFCKKLFSVQDKLVNNKQTHLLNKTSLRPIDKSCMWLFNLSINPVVCWYYFYPQQEFAVGYCYHFWKSCPSGGRAGGRLGGRASHFSCKAITRILFHLRLWNLACS